jgi:hypothetical protein
VTLHQYTCGSITFSGCCVDTDPPVFRRKSIASVGTWLSRHSARARRILGRHLDRRSRDTHKVVNGCSGQQNEIMGSAWNPGFS